MDLPSLATKVPWLQLCKMLEKVQIAKRDTKKEMLQRFIKQYKSMMLENRADKSIKENTFFPVLRILLPSLDRERGAYGIKERKLADLYIRILGLKKEGLDAQKLLNYNKPKVAGSGIGDFAETAFFVMRSRCPEKGQLSLQEVDKHLTLIADSYETKGHGKTVENSLLFMMRAMTATEQKWLIRVLMKEMHLGITESTIFNEWHPDAKDYYDVTNSLWKVSTMLQDPLTRLHEIEISLFTPFRPMLSERVILEKIEIQMKHKTYFAETKYDGERSQLHKCGQKYKYFSRNGFDFTNNFGGGPDRGIFTPHVHNLFSQDVNDIILDGEMVVWSKKHSAIIPKSVNLDVKSLREEGDWQACFCAFDLLYLNGEVLTTWPLSKRIKKLQSVIKQHEGRVIISQATNVLNKEDVIKCLNDAIDNREEGIVLKDPDSSYKPAGRKSGWIKVKPDYLDSLVPELDLVIVGGFYGTGRRKGIIAKFLLAAAVASPIADSEPLEFHSMTKVGSGYTDLQLQILSTKLGKSFTKRQPTNVIIGKEKPDVWIEPTKSCVLQVRGAELVRSSQFKTESTLRFPRVDAIRDDKSYKEVLTVDELNQLFEEGGGKFMSTFNATKPTNETPRKRRKLEIVPPSLPQYFQPADLSAVVQTSALLAGKQLCVVLSGRAKRKHEIEQKIVEYGGSFTQHPGTTTFCVIADELSIKVKNIVKANLYNIIKVEWLEECLTRGRLLPWSPVDIIHVLPQEKDIMQARFDQYGDSYYDPVDQIKLKRIFDAMLDSDWSPLPADEMLEIENQLYEGGNLHGIFRRLRVFADHKDDFIHSEKLTCLRLQLYGAQISEQFNDEVTHILLPQRSTNVRSSYQALPVITSDWVDRCIHHGKLMEVAWDPPTESLNTL